VKCDYVTTVDRGDKDGLVYQVISIQFFTSTGMEVQGVSSKILGECHSYVSEGMHPRFGLSSCYLLRVGSMITIQL